MNKINKINEEDAYIPLDAIHQYAYCPRRAFLMYHDGHWGDNEYTEEGRMIHKRIDSAEEVLQEPSSIDGDDPPQISRSVDIGSISLGIHAKLDLVETAGDEAIPVEYKRGTVPDTPERSWEPERIQLMAQALLLRESGYKSDWGVLYFQKSRTRVPIQFTHELEIKTREIIKQTQLLLKENILPEPLIDNPKCNGCSLVGICLPDETHVLQMQASNGQEMEHKKGLSVVSPQVRRLYPARDDQLPLYVQEQGAVIGKQGEGLRITKGREELACVKLLDISQLVVCGNISISAQAIHLCAENGIPIIHLSMGNWFYCITQGFGLRNSFDRFYQFQVAADTSRCLSIAKSIVATKGINQRTLLRRNARSCDEKVLVSMAKGIQSVESAESLETLLGIEGNLASLYFSNFGMMLKTENCSTKFDWETRNRRPPRDPVNAMLSFGYALLAKECTVALASVGLDPYWGFYHQPRHGRPALALDLMEEFRPVIVDSAVINAINTAMVSEKDFIVTSSGCAMNSKARKNFIRAYEMRLDQLFTHPVFDYRCSWRRIIRIQAQLLARHLRGELQNYQGITTR